MYLKRLEIQGFKTFANHTVLEFRPGVTAIVGPNGSGKSNIADAVRWVLGEQSYAALRSKRSEDIIFGGSGRRAPAGLAQVSLTIDNSDRLLTLPYNEVTFSRRTTRSGENEYMINRSRVRLRDIHEAIGPLGSSYTIINQGLVDSALTLRPEERRQLFEDAAKIGVYTARKAETEGRLREVNANVERSADVLSELEPRLRSLKRQASVARTHREYATELREALECYYVRVWHAAQTQQQDAAALVEAQAALVAQAREAHGAATAAVRAARDAARALQARLQDLQAQSAQLRQQIDRTSRDLAVGEERAAALGRSAEEIARAAHDLAERRIALQEARATLAERLEHTAVRLAEARQAVAAQQQAIVGLEAARRAARQHRDAAQRDEIAATAALNGLRQRIEQTAARRERLTREIAGQDAALAQGEQTLDARHAALGDAEHALRAAVEERAAAQIEEERARAELARLREERARAEEAAAAARRAHADLEARLESLARLQRSYAGTFAGVKAAMQWAETARRAGFMLVSALVRTPAELETAIEVALGSRLQNIVVERWQDAEDAIGALKRAGTGRATFLPLDTLRDRGDGRAETDTGADVLGVAAALVDYDEHYRRVVWSLLGRTLLVRDMATARQQVRQLGGGWALVTLAGEQINNSGAVTGGAQIKEAGILRRERELRELPQQIAAASSAVEARAATRAALDGQISAAEHAIRDAEARRHRANQAHDARRDIADSARRAVEGAAAALETQQRRHAQIADEHAALEAQASTLQAEQATLIEHEQRAKNHSAELRAAEHGHEQQERAAATVLADLRAALAGLESEQRADHMLHQSHGQQLAQIDDQAAANAERVARAEQERAQIEAQMHRMREAHTTLEQQHAALDAVIRPANAERAAHEARSGTLEQHEAERTAAMLHTETAHGRASMDAQRAKDRIETLWERAASDDVDIEALSSQPRGEADGNEEDLDALHARAQQLKARMHRLGAVNPLALEEYEQTAERHSFMSTQINDLRAAADALRALIAELDGAMHTRFETTFNAIAAEFERFFVRLFGGGQAQLLMTSPNATNGDGDGAHDASLANVGIEIMARPPGKRLQTLSLLSGGERALTASALLFSILAVNPSPFCILDEVDAALDEANVGRFRDMLADMTEQTQFLLVTHNRATIEAADTIYGISMGDDGASRVLSLRLEELVEEKA